VKSPRKRAFCFRNVSSADGLAELDRPQSGIAVGAEGHRRSVGRAAVEAIDARNTSGNRR